MQKKSKQSRCILFAPGEHPTGLPTRTPTNPQFFKISSFSGALIGNESRFNHKIHCKEIGTIDKNDKLNSEAPRNMIHNSINHGEGTGPSKIYQADSLLHQRLNIQNAQKKYNAEVNNVDQQYLSERLALRELKEKMDKQERTNTNTCPKKKSSLKFPMPKHYEPNRFPSRNLSTQELLNEMVTMYDQKIQPKHFETFIKQNIKRKIKKNKNEKNMKLHQEKKKNKLKKKGKLSESDSESEAEREDEKAADKTEIPLEEPREQGEEIVIEFNNLESHQFNLSNNVKIPDREGNFLPYLNIKINIMSEEREVIALKDSGASHCILDINEFKKWKNSKNIKVKARKLKMITPNATTENAIQGEVELNFSMEGIDGKVTCS